ncbi:MAG TPA: YbgC/FadM family acyl-CoA thioesterase [Gammaproteobacteria bacterium]
MGDLSWPVRVYLEDTDAQGVVYNASYFRFMERARTEWLRAHGAEHDELRVRYGIFLVLAAVEAKFHAPARLGDMLHVGARVSKLRGARVVFTHEIRRHAEDGELVCRATAEVACMDAERGGPRRLPAELLSEWER